MAKHTPMDKRGQSWTLGAKPISDSCIPHKRTRRGVKGCSAFGGTHRAPNVRPVLVEAFQRNKRVQDPERLTTDANRVCKAYAHNHAGEFDRFEYEEFVMVAAMAALIAGGMTTEDAIIDYLSGKYAGTGTKYVFGVGRIDTPYAPVTEPGDRESKLEWAKAHENSYTGGHTQGGKTSEEGNTAPTITARPVDNSSTAIAGGNTA